jgi:flagellar biosynthesis chaperone FliJ
MIQFETPEQNATQTMSVEVDINLAIVKDLINIAENRVKLLENQANQINARCYTIIRQLRALANTYNNLSKEERLKAETRITKLTINYENAITRLWTINFQYSDLNDRIERLKTTKKIFISDLI